LAEADSNRNCDTLENCAGLAELAEAPDSKSARLRLMKVEFLICTTERGMMNKIGGAGRILIEH
jgi:hypothetical protein